MLAPIKRFNNKWLRPAIAPQEARTTVVRLPAGDYPMGLVLGEATNAAALPDIQTVTVTGTPTGGQFTLMLGGIRIGPINYSSTAGTLQTNAQAAFDASALGAGTVAVSASSGTSFTATFQGQALNIDPGALTPGNNSLTGGTSPNFSVARTQIGNAAGGYAKAYAAGNSDGTQNPRYVLQYPVTVNAFGGHAVAGSAALALQTNAPAYYSGHFYCSELAGLDQNALDKLGRLVQGATLSSAGSILRIA